MWTDKNDARTRLSHGDALGIYVASLTDYNNGNLHGVWIDLEMCCFDPDEVMEVIEAMLEESPTAGPDSVCPAEEWAIHDYNNLHNLGFGEYGSLEEVCAVAKMIEEHGEAFRAWFTHCSDGSYEDDADTMDTAFTDAYQGCFRSEVDFAEDYVDGTGMLHDVPEELQRYFDFESFARDLFMDGFTAVYVDGECYVFSDY